jgi:DNA-binding NarL/FixJ family response regulator
MAGVRVLPGEARGITLVSVSGASSVTAAEVLVGATTGTGVVTVSVIDEQAVTRVGLEQVLSAHPGIEVVSSASGLGQLASFPTAPDVVLLSLPASHRGSLGDFLSGRLPNGAVLLILNGARDLPGSMAEMARLHVHGAISRDAQLEEVLFAVGAVARGGWYLSAELTEQLCEEGSGDAARPTLTPREIEAARLLAKGLTHRQIARHMGLTEETINTYVKRMRAKFNVGNKAALTRMLIEHGYVGTDLPIALPS